MRNLNEGLGLLTVCYRCPEQAAVFEVNPSANSDPGAARWQAPSPGQPAFGCSRSLSLSVGSAGDRGRAERRGRQTDGSRGRAEVGAGGLTEEPPQAALVKSSVFTACMAWLLSHLPTAAEAELGALHLSGFIRNRLAWVPVFLFTWWFWFQLKMSQKACVPMNHVGQNKVSTPFKEFSLMKCLWWQAVYHILFSII